MPNGELTVPAPPTVIALRQKLFDASLDSAKSIYAARVDQWKTLETKAQGTVAVAGIFLGGVFAMARDVKVETGNFERTLLMLTSISLLLAVAAAVLALHVRATPMPGGKLNETVKRLLLPERTDQLEDRVPRFIGDRARDLHTCASKLATVNKTKAAQLRGAQWFLFASALLVCALIGHRVLGL